MIAVAIVTERADRFGQDYTVPYHAGARSRQVIGLQAAVALLKRSIAYPHMPTRQERATVESLSNVAEALASNPDRTARLSRFVVESPFTQGKMGICQMISNYPAEAG